MMPPEAVEAGLKKIAASVGLALLAGPGLAQGLTVYGGAELEVYHDENGPSTGTTSYLSGYVELEFSGFYGGVWAQVADDDLMDEYDLYLGCRNALDLGLSYDFSYMRYFYPNDGGNCCGEYLLSLGMPFGDQFSGSLDVYHDPDADLSSAHLGAAFAATDALELSANWESYEVDGAGNEQEWDLGATYYLGEETSADLRNYDGSEYAGSYWGLSLAWDSTLLGG